MITTRPPDWIWPPTFSVVPASMVRNWVVVVTVPATSIEPGLSINNVPPAATLPVRVSGAPEISGAAEAVMLPPFKVSAPLALAWPSTRLLVVSSVMAPLLVLAVPSASRLSLTMVIGPESARLAMSIAPAPAVPSPVRLAPVTLPSDTPAKLTPRVRVTPPAPPPMLLALEKAMLRVAAAGAVVPASSTTPLPVIARLPTPMMLRVAVTVKAPPDCVTVPARPSVTSLAAVICTAPAPAAISASTLVFPVRLRRVTLASAPLATSPLLARSRPTTRLPTLATTETEPPLLTAPAMLTSPMVELISMLPAVVIWPSVTAPLTTMLLPKVAY